MGKKFNMVLKTLDARRDAIIDEICRLEDTVFPQGITEEERDILDSRIHDLEVSLREIDFIRNTINGPAWGFGFYDQRHDLLADTKIHEKYYWSKNDEICRSKDGE